MKKKISRILGVGLVVTLVASLLIAAAPISASTLAWGSEDLPDELATDNEQDILDVAVAADGETVYTCFGTENISRSTDGGEGWTSIIAVIDTTDFIEVDLIAVAADDENYIAVANSANSTVWISDDAGANWTTLVSPGTSLTTNDMALSVEKSGNHFVALAITDTANAEVWYYEIGAVGAVWTDATTGDAGSGFTSGTGGEAIAFSPNFASDQVMITVTADTSADTVDFQIFSFNQEEWNVDTGTFADYPVDLSASGDDFATFDSASIALAPDYLGSDDAMRVAFVGVTVDGGTATELETSGVFRLDDDDLTVLKDEIHIHSVDFDGTNLVAGRYDDNDVYRSADPLASSPTVTGSTSTKSPGGDSLVVVAWAGADVVVGTSGDESAFARSTDNGKTFNDISLIDTNLSTLEDVAVSPDGEKVYLLTSDATSDTDNMTDLSVWRYASSWERILSLKGTVVYTSYDNYIIRLAPDDADVIYLAAKTGTTLRYSTNGGMEKWHTRTSRYSITDLAVEGDGGVAFVLTDNGYVSKSSNSGFTWDTKNSSKLTAGGSMITSMGEDKLLAGSIDGEVAYSTDGGVTWTELSDGMTSGAVQVVATGLEDGDFVLAAVDSANDYIYQWEIGEDDEWNERTDDDFIPAGYKVYGLALAEGVLYATGASATDNNSQLYRTLDPTDSDPSWSTVNSTDEEFTATPQGLKTSTSEGITKLWAIDAVAPALFSFEDTLAVAGVVLVAPRDGFNLGVNPVTGRASQVIFSWRSLSDDITEWDFVIATDTDFDEIILEEAVAKTADEDDVVTQLVGPFASDAFAIDFMPNTTYYWKVRVDLAGPARSAYSDVRTFTTGELEVGPPVVIEQPPAPIIQVPEPAPLPPITITPPDIILPAPAPAPEIVIPPAPAPPAPVSPAWIWAIVIIGAVLVIAVIVLIVRTRRPV